VAFPALDRWVTTSHNVDLLKKMGYDPEVPLNAKLAHRRGCLVDDTLAQLVPLLDRDDIVIHGGNYCHQDAIHGRGHEDRRRCRLIQR
jgi:6-phosphogluconate dehydrogenase